MGAVHKEMEYKLLGRCCVIRSLEEKNATTCSSQKFPVAQDSSLGVVA